MEHVDWSDTPVNISTDDLFSISAPSIVIMFLILLVAIYITLLEATMGLEAGVAFVMNTLEYVANTTDVFTIRLVCALRWAADGVLTNLSAVALTGGTHASIMIVVIIILCAHHARAHSADAIQATSFAGIDRVGFTPAMSYPAMSLLSHSCVGVTPAMACPAVSSHSVLTAVAFPITSAVATASVMAFKTISSHSTATACAMATTAATATSHATSPAVATRLDTAVLPESPAAFIASPQLTAVAITAAAAFIASLQLTAVAINACKSTSRNQTCERFWCAEFGTC
jgi:hypothetical protein